MLSVLHFAVQLIQSLQPVDVFLTNNRDLYKYKLTNSKWEILKAYRKILLVSSGVAFSAVSDNIYYLGTCCFSAKTISREDTNSF